LVHDADDHIDVGVLGGRVLFHVLTEFGYSDLAFEMIARPDYPSYGNWIERGATTLWENFMPDRVSSMNHHFWGDISAWFIKCIAGIRLNPSKNDVSKLEIRPGFIGSLNEAKAYHIAPLGKIVSEWKKDGEKIVLNLEIPDGMSAKAKLEKGFSFDDGTSEKEVVTGKYEIIINN